VECSKSNLAPAESLRTCSLFWPHGSSISEHGAPYWSVCCRKQMSACAETPELPQMYDCMHSAVFISITEWFIIINSAPPPSELSCTALEWSWYSDVVACHEFEYKSSTFKPSHALNCINYRMENIVLAEIHTFTVLGDKDISWFSSANLYISYMKYVKL
jgi:hypothetical protein